MQGECDSFVSTNFDPCDDAYSLSIRKVKVHALHYANELLVRLRLPFKNILHIVIPRQTEVPATQVNVEVAWLYFQLYQFGVWISRSNTVSRVCYITYSGTPPSVV